MRILWITANVLDIFFPRVKGKPTKGASWIAPLFYSLHRQPGVELGMITPVIDGEEQKEEINRVVYYTVPINKDGNRTEIKKELADSYLRAVTDFQPDIIHVHGTEYNFGLLRNHVDKKIPIVCSIQGIISPWLTFMNYSVADTDVKKHRSIKNRMGRGGVNGALRRWKNYPVVEKEIFEINQYFIGRTLWDKAYVNIYNPDASYFHGEELLRAPFYTTRWNINTCEKHSVFISSCAYSRKGFHVLIKAAGLLKNKYPDIKIVAPLSSMRVNASKWVDLFISEDYDVYLKKEIARWGLQKNVLLLKNLNSQEMADEYQKAHVFALPSFQENSPNSLGEAMMVGTPSVAAPVGGVMSMVKDESSSLIFPSGDYVMMAHQIDRLFSDEELALKVSQNARLIAERRHNIVESTLQYMGVYEEIVKKHTSKN
ncbi:MAG: glycosyltransferase family 4 protein [Proteiniphilum sp.]|jgi:glycosyltransferase involved in cell wall biosynthesis|uniref:glycosyltransferase family 4 protein n=1 Tax=Proteiniphilum sp. TaxID=1926877 RepID=UPI002B1F9F10|nr:glycosyltransferase family 4 protein [Proteiniphilum sp.]MEA5126989.1 glycosyltransferase family 4 protein [Proteiniphilum sp.]